MPPRILGCVKSWDALFITEFRFSLNILGAKYWIDDFATPATLCQSTQVRLPPEHGRLWRGASRPSWERGIFPIAMIVKLWSQTWHHANIPLEERLPF